jgi:hypothetical protein
MSKRLGVTVVAAFVLLGSASGLAGSAEPPDLALRRLDEEIDRKLIICRGC